MALYFHTLISQSQLTLLKFQILQALTKNNPFHMLNLFSKPQVMITYPCQKPQPKLIFSNPTIPIEPVKIVIMSPLSHRSKVNRFNFLKLSS